MYKKQFIYIKPETNSTPQDQVNQCLTSIKKTLNVHQGDFRQILKQTVFLNAENNDDFYIKRQELLSILEQFYGPDLPPTAVVGQPPENRKFLTIELILLTEQRKEIEIHRKNLDNTAYNYTVVNYPAYKEVYAAGFTAADKSADILTQSKEAFEQMKKMLEQENMDFSHVVRQWNYIENITGSTFLEDRYKQNYQVFNDTRALYYGRSNFTDGYPAATGIGMNYGGVVLEFIAVNPSKHVEIIPIKNPEQLDAHQYSQTVLVGDAIKELPQKASPKFERAKVMANQKSYFIYISGTAAIRGEETIGAGDVETQTLVTIENISKLVSPGNLGNYGVYIGPDTHPLSYLRVYVKNENDLPKVKKICASYFKGVPGEFLISDICRDSLLVEIEGVVEY